MPTVAKPPARYALLAILLLASSCRSGSKDATPTVPTPVLTTVTVTMSATTIQVGQGAQATASGLDQNNAPIATGAVTWSSTTPTVATISASGSIMADAVGQTTITALAAGGRSGQATLTVIPVPVASVTVSPAATTLGVGSTQQLTATMKDANGNVLTGRTVAWSTSDATKATVSQAGLVSAVALGNATITATSGGTSGTATITVAAVPVASVAVAPAATSLTVGGTATITATALDASGNALVGKTFSWTTSDQNIVSGTGVGGVLTATGVGVGTATVTATSEGKSASSVVIVTAAATSVTLPAAGQSMAFLNSPSVAAALTVQPGSQYLIAVVNTDPSYTINESFTLSGTFGAVSASQFLSGPPRPLTPAYARTPDAPTPDFARTSGLQERIAIQQQADRNHLAILEQNRQIFAHFGSPTAAWAQARAHGGRNAPVSASVTQTVGMVSKVYVNKFSGSCTDVDSIGARTVAVGQHVIVLADTDRTAWPQAYRPDSSFYQTFADEYDQVTYPHLLNYIGNPLAYDASLSGAGKVTVTLTPKLNNAPGLPGGGTVVAVVFSCDFYPFATSGPDADFSNQTEMMYAAVPSATFLSLARWEAQLRATAAHESKHIVSFADRILNNSPQFEESWLEEGLAQISAEVWERHFNQATWKGHATFLQTVTCEIDFGASAPCDVANNRPLALMFNHLPYLWSYLSAESGSNSEGLGVDAPSKYGAGWNLARWVIDQYASPGGEGTFIQSLINTTQTGLANLSAHSGQSIPLILTYWNVASAIFQTPAYSAADVRTTIPSFNFADIFKNLQSVIWNCAGTPCGYFTTSGLPVYPVLPIAFGSGTFSRAIQAVPGTSASFFLLSGSTAGIETLTLLSGSGGALSASSGFRVAILRVQ